MDTREIVLADSKAPLVKLRVEARGLIEVSKVAGFLRALDDAYDSIYVAALIIPVVSRLETELIPDYMEFRRQRETENAGRWDKVLGTTGKILEIDAAPWNPKFWALLLKALVRYGRTETEHEVGKLHDTASPPLAAFIRGLPMTEARRFIPSGERLVLKAVELHSPGFWEFIGRFLPLEVIRLAINDAHERRKDREYRESGEKRTIELENALREARLLREQIELAKSMGATEYDLQQLLERFVYRPLLKVSDHSEKASIHNAQIENVDPK